MKFWYAVNTHPHQEARAHANLLQQDFEAWMPKLLRTRRHARRADTVQAPLFPGYLFVSIDNHLHGWRAINSTIGVRNIVSGGGRPSPVKNGFVEALIDAADENGVLSLAVDLQPGQPLRLLNGPFVDCVGTLVRLSGKDRIALLLSLLGREVQILVSRRDVVAIG